VAFIILVPGFMGGGISYIRTVEKKEPTGRRSEWGLGKNLPYSGNSRGSGQRKKESRRQKVGASGKVILTGGRKESNRGKKS